MNYDTYAKVLTIYCRVMGIFALSASPVAFLSALIDTGNRIALIVLGVVLIVVGIAFLRAKSITGDQIDPNRKDS